MPSKKYTISPESVDIVLRYGPTVSKGIVGLYKEIENLEKEAERLRGEIRRLQEGVSNV